MKKNGVFILSGVLIGGVAIALAALGNPGNMGFCIACFLRDIAGSCSLHSAGVVQNFRPEIVGLLIGAFVMAVLSKEFNPKGGSAPFTRFLLGMVATIGALMFLGCPLRMMLRIGGGDLNAIVGLAGFVVGILGGIFALNKGFNLRRAYKMGKAEGIGFTVVLVGLFVLSLAIPSLFKLSTEGPGSMYAPIWAALLGGILVGAVCQRQRVCTVAGIRDAIMFKEFRMLWVFLTIIATVLVGNLILGTFNLGFADQPIAHTDGLWNFLGMALSGLCFTLLGGCPLRQLILTGEGNSDSAMVVLGLIAGAAFAHNFGLAASGKGPTFNGQIAVAVGFVIVAIIAVMYSREQA